MEIIITNNLELVDVPQPLAGILMEKLTLTNPKWIENERMGRWNRGTPKVIKFYHKYGRTLWIPRGYIRRLADLCKQEGIPYHINDKRRSLEETGYSFNGTLRPFQKEAVDIMLEKEFGTLSAATGSGKTIMALYMVAQRKQPALIIVHTKELAGQWAERINAFLGIPVDEVGLIGAGKQKIGEKITIALVQSLYKCADEVSRHIGFLIVDECHRCPSRTFTEAVTEFDSRYMLGLSATPWRRDKLSQLIFWHLGDVQHEVDKHQLIENKHILKAEIITRATDFITQYDPVNEYSKMLSQLTTDTNRNILIASDVAEEVKKGEGISLVISDRKAHCEAIRAILKYRFKIPSELLTGDIPDADRQKIIEQVNKGTVKVLVATGQLIGEGLDCKNLSTLFLATPIRFSGRVLQYIGRILRPAPGKKHARVFDYIDINIDVLRSAARARQKVYSL